MNWGHYITISFILFAAFIMYMVVKAFSVNIDLVTEDYYAQEIAYEGKMIQKANFENLGASIKVTQTDQGVELYFPEEIQSPEGEIHFYHPSRKIFDKKISIALDDSRKQMMDRDELVAGRYHVKITWTSAGKEYFQQTAIYIK